MPGSKLDLSSLALLAGLSSLALLAGLPGSLAHVVVRALWVYSTLDNAWCVVKAETDSIASAHTVPSLPLSLSLSLKPSSSPCLSLDALLYVTARSSLIQALLSSLSLSSTLV
jgi:hypothetical protein